MSGQTLALLLLSVHPGTDEFASHAEI